MLVMQGLMVFPLTSISQAPQFPDRQPVGILIFAFFALMNQSSPSFASVEILFGQFILMLGFFKKGMQKGL